MRRVLTALVVVVAGAAATSCGYLRGDPEPYRTPAYYGPPEQAAGAAPVDPGRHLYMRDCAYCHGSDGSGTGRGPSLLGGTNGGALTDFVLRTGRMPIEAPVAQMSPGRPVYDEGQIASIVSYVKSEFRPPGPDIPEIDVRRGNLAEGQQVYQEHCASCHATTGIGGAMLIQGGREVPGPTRGIVIPGIEHSDAHAIADAVRAGPGSMPVFGTRAISDEQLNSLVRYTLYLQQPRDAGGAPIGRIGPVAEGAIGWLVGLTALILVIRWIGTKAGEHP